MLDSIILVHGLGGHPIDTWTWKPSILNKASSGIKDAFKSKKGQIVTDEGSASSPTGVVFWPKDLLPLSIKNARILTYGYDSDPVHFFESVHRSSIYQQATNFLDDLAAERAADVCI